MHKRNLVPILNIITLSLIFLAIGFYLFGANQVSTKKSEIIYLKEQIRNLEDTNQQLEIELAQKQSMNNLASLSKTLGFVKVEEIKYLKLEGEVARR